MRAPPTTARAALTRRAAFLQLAQVLWWDTYLPLLLFNCATRFVSAAAARAPLAKVKSALESMHTPASFQGLVQRHRYIQLVCLAGAVSTSAVLGGLTVELGLAERTDCSRLPTATNATATAWSSGHTVNGRAVALGAGHDVSLWAVWLAFGVKLCVELALFALSCRLATRTIAAACTHDAEGGQDDSAGEGGDELPYVLHTSALSAFAAAAGAGGEAEVESTEHRFWSRARVHLVVISAASCAQLWMLAAAQRERFMCGSDFARCVAPFPPGQTCGEFSMAQALAFKCARC